MPVVVTSFQQSLGPSGPSLLALDGHNYTVDNYSIANPAVVQTDKTIVSLWFRWDGSGPSAETFNFMIHNSGGRFYVDFSPAGQIQIKVYNAAVAIIQWTVSSTPNSAWGTDNTWHHVLYSRSGTTSHLYIDDVDDLLDTNPNIAGNASNNSANGWYVGMAFNNTFGFKGCLSNIYQNHQEYLDFSIVANRRKFINADGTPVDPGVDGSTPTGSQPEVWMPEGLPTNNGGSTGNYALVSGDGAVPCPTFADGFTRADEDLVANANWETVIPVAGAGKLILSTNEITISTSGIIAHGAAIPVSVYDFSETQSAECTVTSVGSGMGFLNDTMFGLAVRMQASGGVAFGWSNGTVDGDRLRLRAIGGNSVAATLGIPLVPGDRLRLEYNNVSGFAFGYVARAATPTVFVQELSFDVANSGTPIAAGGQPGIYHNMADLSVAAFGAIDDFRAS